MRLDQAVIEQFIRTFKVTDVLRDGRLRLHREPGAKEDGVSMISDTPSPPSAAAVNAFINTLPNPATIQAIRVTMNFDVYMFVDGVLFYRYAWQWVAEIPAAGGFGNARSVGRVHSGPAWGVVLGRR